MSVCPYSLKKCDYTMCWVVQCDRIKDDDDD